MRLRRSAIAVLSGALLCTASLYDASAAEPLRKIGFTALDGYEGDFDHFMADSKGNRLFLAAEDHGTLELFTLDSVKHLKTIEGVEEPHTLFLVPGKNELLITDSGEGGAKIFDATTYALKGKANQLGLGSDAEGYDPASKHLYIATGGKNAKLPEASLEEFDPATGTVLGKIPFKADALGSMAFESNGPRLFVAEMPIGKVSVIDKKTRQKIAEWAVPGVEDACMLQFDEASHRLFVVSRKPAKLTILNSDTGASVASFAVPQRADDFIFDAASHRLYVLAGEGYISVFQQKGADSYSEIARVPTAPGAKTGILVPELHRLYVAVSPGEGKSDGAGVLQYEVVND